MSNVVLVRGSDRALYVDGELVGTWDKHDMPKYSEAQIDARCGDEGFVERDHEGAWPESVEGEKATAKKASPKKADAPKEVDQGEMDWIDD